MVKYANEMQENVHKHGRAAWPVMRQQAIKTIREVQDLNSVAATYGMNVRSVFRWLAYFANGGQNALLSKLIPGRLAEGEDRGNALAGPSSQRPTPLQFKFGGRCP